VVLILRADNHGEGGLIAMLALASQAVKDRPALRRRLLLLGIFGTAVFYGDGVITPAVSVLSAIEGLEVAAPALHRWVVPLALLVLTALFAVQRVSARPVSAAGSGRSRCCGSWCWRGWGRRMSCANPRCWRRCRPPRRRFRVARTRASPSAHWARWCCA
jgi:hypothetical protein